MVRLVQSGLSADANWDEMYDALVDGWTYFLFNLAFYLARHRGKPRGMVWKRAATVKVRAQNVEGEVFELDADGLLAVAIQHELDHLQGKLFVDYISEMKRSRIKKKLIKSLLNMKGPYLLQPFNFEKGTKSLLFSLNH